jgi:type I restriction enzyme, S subunit
MVATLASRFGQLKELPADWRTGRIADYAIIKTGSRNTQDRIDDGKYPFFVRSQIVERINDFSFNGEAVLTAGDGVGTGKVFHYINGPFDCHQRVYRITDFSPELDGYYFYLYFSNHFYDRIMSMTAKSSVDSVRMEMIADMQIPLPPVPEQKAIAKALLDIEDLIQSLERLIAKKRGLKQAAMQQLLTGQTRLPGFSGEWQMRTLGSLGKCYRGVSYQPDRDLSPFDTSGTLRLLRANNVQNARMVFEDMQYVSAVRVSEVQRLRPKDVLICMANGSRALVGKAAVFPDAADAAYTFGAFMGCFRPTPGLAESRFVFLLFQTEAYRKDIDLLLAGSSINNLRPSSIEALAVPIPSMISEQAAIAEVLSDMDAEVTALEARLTKTRDLKQGMMQELLTGRTRLV